MPIDKPDHQDIMAIFDRYEPQADMTRAITPDMTAEEIEAIRREKVRYRFSGFRPGSYQGITGQS